MNRSRIAPLGLALLCITSIGVVGTTLDSSLTTDPADEIDLNYDRLPIGTSDAATIRDEIESGEVEGGADEGGEIEGGADEGGEIEGGADEGGEIEGGEGEDIVTEHQFQEVESIGSQATPPTFLERLLAFFEGIAHVLLLFGVMITLIALIYHYRERLSVILRTATATDDGETDTITAANTWPGVEPSNPVDQAWLWMVHYANPEHPETKTPGECATIACEVGIDPTIVETITDAFERVHYGGVPVECETARSQAALEQLRNDGQRQSNGGPQRHYGGND